MFGAAAKRLPYIECSMGGQGTPQTTECRNAGITTYPTWEIDGKRYVEVLTTAAPGRAHRLRSGGGCRRGRKPQTPP